jgi:hypothetical protein
MKFFKRIVEIWEAFTIKVPLAVRITLGIVLFGGIVTAIILSIVNPRGNQPSERSENKENVYLYEEVEFADEIYIKVIGINVIEENDIYTLNLQVRIEQWNTDFNVNQQVIRPEMFELRLVDKYADSPMSVFIENLVKATVSAMASGVVDGGINVIEETLSFAGDYVTGIIENATSEEGRTIEANPDTFEPFYPYMKNGISTVVELSFVLNEEFLKSNKTMVLSIDDGLRRVQKNIFLVLRSNTSPYTIQYDLDGGSQETLMNPISVGPGQIIELPDDEPIKEGYKFLYWTSEKGKKATKLRDLYFYTYEENKVFNVFAFYQPLIPLDVFANIGDNISFKDNTILLKVTNATYSSEVVVQNSNHEEVLMQASSGKKYLILNITIEKTLTGNDHKLDNKNDFYLENDHAKENVSGYYGYTDFKSIKPIDDYSWIELEINQIGLYEITLVFEVFESLDFQENLYFLEVDFYATSFADSVIIR